MKKIILLFLLAILQPVWASAEDITIDGLNYYLYLDSHKAALREGTWTGELNIPSEIEYNEEAFVVNSMCLHAFVYSPNITKVKIPKTLVEILHYYPYDLGDDEEPITGEGNPIYMNPFPECTALESIEVDEENPSLKSVDGVLYSQDGVGEYYYGYNTYCGTGLYCYPKGKKQEAYAIPESVEWIGGNAFSHNQYLTTLTIPSSIKHICYDAISYCSNLKDVYCKAENVPTAWDNAFKETPISSATLHVPAGSVDKYKATSPWKDFGTIVGIPEEYYPEGTKWTEIRLDTLKYNSWYSKVGEDWVPNYEIIEYRVQGEYGEASDNYWNAPYKCVYTNSSEWTDSLTLLISEGEINGLPTGVLVTVLDVDQPLCPSSYLFEWEVGTMIKFKDILAANMPAIFPPDLFDFGIVEEIEVEDFGGVRPLKYSDVKGVRMIQGIGVATWNDGECIFGPLDPYKALPTPHEESRHYRSMLVHFERNNEVLYDVWPKKEIPSSITVKDAQSANQGIIFDLQGRRVSNPQKGIYIKEGRKVLVK